MIDNPEEFAVIEVFANEYLYYPSEPNLIIRFMHNNKIYVVGYDIEEAPSISKLRDERGYCKPPSDLVSKLKKVMKEQREATRDGDVAHPSFVLPTQSKRRLGMIDLSKAAEQALEVLEDVPYMSNKDDCARLKKTTFLPRQALEEPAQEPIYAFQYQAQVTDLKEALYQISLCSKNSMSSKEECGHIARTAIEKLGSVSRQEPVAWLSDSPTKGNGRRLYFTKEQAWHWSSNITPLYVAPQAPEQPKREWVELTDDEIEQVGIDYVEGKYILPFGFARAIEVKLKEKNT